MRKNNVAFMAQAAMIAAIYVVLTYVFAPFSFGQIQVRISEAMTILPLFTSAAVPGLFIGCLLGNVLGGAILPDILFGSIATLLGAMGTYFLRKQKPIVGIIPPILVNILVVPLVLRYGYGINLPLVFLQLTVGVGEVISCGVLGMGLYMALNRYRNILFQ